MKKLLGLLCLLALLFAFAPVARAVAPTPREGHYAGFYHHDIPIAFTYSKAHSMTHFTINHHHTLATAFVHHAHWLETCQSVSCTSGMWHSATSVRGTYQHHPSPKVIWTAHWVRAL